MTEFLTPLPADRLRPLGIPAPWAYGEADKVRFHEIDALGHVNNAAYLSWYEKVRVGWFRDYGISSYSPEDPTFVLRKVECEYLAPMFLNDPYIVTARCRSFRRTSFTKEYGVWSKGALVATGVAVIVMTDASGIAKLPLTQAMRNAMAGRDGAVAEG